MVCNKGSAATAACCASASSILQTHNAHSWSRNSSQQQLASSFLGAALARVYGVEGDEETCHQCGIVDALEADDKAVAAIAAAEAQRQAAAAEMPMESSLVFSQSPTTAPAAAEALWPEERMLVLGMPAPRPLRHSRLHRRQCRASSHPV